MVVTLRRIGDEWGFMLDDEAVKKLNWSDGMSFQVEPTADGRGAIFTPATDEEAAADDRAARVREASSRAMKRHEAAFRKLAE